MAPLVNITNKGYGRAKKLWSASTTSDSEDADAEAGSNNFRKLPVLDPRIKKKPTVFIKAVVALLLHRIEGFWARNNSGEYAVNPESGKLMRYYRTLSFTAEAQGVFNAAREEGFAKLDLLDVIDYNFQYGIFAKSEAVCGEISLLLHLAEEAFAGMGSSVPHFRQQIGSVILKKAQKIVQTCLQASAALDDRALGFRIRQDN